jgi:hypothetical protein
MATSKTRINAKQAPGSYGNQPAVDKSPREGRGKKEKVTPRDLKGKKVDADPSKKSDRPLNSSR